MKKLHTSALFFLIIVCLLCTHSIAGEAEKDALKAAGEWLILIDTGEYGLSWDNAAELFKQAITKEQWEKTLKAVRPALGDLISRNVKSATYANSLPGAPDGETTVNHL